MGSATGGAEPLGSGPRFLLSAFGLGYAPVMPGTFGSLGTAAAIYGAHQLGVGTGWIVAVVLLLFGILVTLRWGGVPRNVDGAGDPGWVVSDEVAGQALASMAALAGAGVFPHLLAFALFRLFDIAKPGGIRRLERVPGGLGVLLDDLAAAVPAGVIVMTTSLLGLSPA